MDSCSKPAKERLPNSLTVAKYLSEVKEHLFNNCNNLPLSALLRSTGINYLLQNILNTSQEQQLYGTTICLVKSPPANGFDETV